MTHGLEAITTRALGLALDAASLRQQAAAANIANQGAPGHVPLRVDFERQMEQARRDLAAGGGITPAALSAVVPRLEAALDARGQALAVRLDEQVAAMAGNAVEYQTLARALSRHLGILFTAASDGRR